MLLFLLIQFMVFICISSDVSVGTTNEELVALVRDMKTKMLTMSSTIEDLSHKVSEQEGLLRNQRLLLPGVQSKVETVAFYAQLDHDVSLGHLQQVIFGKVFTNVGNGYNLSHGHFTAPFNGVYHFSVSIMAFPGKTCSVVFVKNGNIISYLYAHGNYYSSQTDNVVLNLEVGDMVWVQERSGFTAESLHHTHTTFSGFLISTDN